MQGPSFHDLQSLKQSIIIDLVLFGKEDKQFSHVLEVVLVLIARIDELETEIRQLSARKFN